MIIDLSKSTYGAASYVIGEATNQLIEHVRVSPRQVMVFTDSIITGETLQKMQNLVISCLKKEYTFAGIETYVSTKRDMYSNRCGYETNLKVTYLPKEN